MATIITFATGCAIRRSAEGAISIDWNNGNSIQAITGASVDYVEPHMRIRGTLEDGLFTYAFAHDVAAMIAGNVDPVLAVITAMCRKTILALPSARVNIGECTVVTGNEDLPAIAAATFTTIQTQQVRVKAIINQCLTVFGLNGLSMLLKGHNYIGTDKMWNRLNEAVTLSEHFEQLGLADWEDCFFHDMAHPFDLSWKVLCVVRENSPLIGHVNGVFLNRFPGVPAGTAIISAALAAISEILLMRPAARVVLDPLHEILADINRRIRAEPLEWCAHFQRNNTARNLHVVSELRQPCAFLYGMCLELFDRRSTVLKSIALRNNSAQHAAWTASGRNYADNLEAEDITDQLAAAMLAPALDAANAAFVGLQAIIAADEFEDGNVEDDDVAASDILEPADDADDAVDANAAGAQAIGNAGGFDDD